MAEYKVKLERQVTETQYIVVRDGDDWDGRPVSDPYDAADLAYDLANENQGGETWQTAGTEIVE